MKKLFPSGPGRSSEKLTDLYLIILLCVFPLFFGTDGYESITGAKHRFWLWLTGLWLAGLVLCFLAERGNKKHRRTPGAWAALALLGVCLLSYLRSPWREAALWGAGRGDGLVTDALYVLTFLGVSRFARPKKLHAAALALGAGLCCAVGVLQLFGLDPLGLFPKGLTFYDSGILYSGVYLGTMGNTNILDALLCVALPLCGGLYVCEASPLFLLPLLPCCFVLGRAGGAGAAAALGAGALAAGPLLCTDGARLRRFLRLLAAALLPLGAALAYQPDYAFGLLSPRFALTGAAAGALGGGAALLALSYLTVNLSPTRRGLLRCFLLLDAAAVLGLVLLALSRSGPSGTLYELGRVLRGDWEDGFGSSRVRIWRECLSLVPEYPLLGGGPGTLALRLNIDFSRFVPETGQTLRASVDNAHNVYLGWLVNCGALGLAAYLWLLLSAAQSALGSMAKPLTAALLLALLCGAVHGLFGLGLSLSEPVFWIVPGLLCASRRNDMEASS